MSSLSVAGPSDRTLEISSTLSAISKRTLPAASAARATTVSSSSAAFNSDDLHSYQTLPARYRRRPLTQDEMEYIEVSSRKCTILTNRSNIFRGSVKFIGSIPFERTSSSHLPRTWLIQSVNDWIRN